MAIAALGGPLPAAATAGLKEVVKFALDRYELAGPTRDLKRQVSTSIRRWADGELIADETVELGLALATRAVAQFGVTDEESAQLDYNAAVATRVVVTRAAAHDGYWGTEDHYLIAESATVVTYTALYQQLRGSEKVLLPAVRAVRADIATYADRVEAGFRRIDDHYADIKGDLSALRELMAQLRPDARIPGVVVIGELPIEPPGFVLRKQALRLAQFLTRPGVCVLVGLPGTGKSQLAAACARERVADGWPLVGWVNAATRDELLTGAARVAEAVGVGDPDGDSLESAYRLRDHLQTTTDPGLLVFDNAVDPALLRPLLPAAGGIRVLITSTDGSLRTLGREAIEVRELDRDEAIGYLTSRTGRLDPSGAATVAAELGDLPVALAQAVASLLGPPPMSYSEWLEEFAALPVKDALGWRPGQDYPRSAAAALLLSIQGAERPEGGGPHTLTGNVLRVAALLSPAGFHPALLEALAPADLGAVPARRAVRDALGRCVGRSLLTGVEQTAGQAGQVWVMHRLVARVLRDRDTTDGTLTQTISTALDLLEGQLFAEEEAWARRGEGHSLVGHIQALWEVCEHLTDVTGILARVLRVRSWAVRQLTAAADFSRAISVATQTLTDSERILGLDHPGTLESRHNLARAYLDTGNHRLAIFLFEETLAARERVPGPDHPDTMTSRNALARAYRTGGDFGQAIPLFKQTLADRVRILGPDHPDTLTSRNNLAFAYLEDGGVDQAIRLYEQTLIDRRRVLGNDHAKTLTSRNNLAFAYLRAGKFDQAIPLFESTLSDRRRFLREDDPKVLNSRHNVAIAYRHAGDLIRAIPMLEMNLDDRRRVLGAEHPATLLSANDLGVAYREAGELSRAIAIFEQTLTARQRVLGDDHRDTLASRNNLLGAIAEQADGGEPG